MKKNWYAVYTKPQCEKKVADLLRRKKIERYCPLNCIVRQRADQKKIVYDPLFTSFVFVQIEDLDLTKVKKIDGVINFIYWLGTPAVIADKEIETIKLFLKEYRNVKLERTPVDIGGSVQITNEPVMNEQSNNISVENKMKATLPSLGYMLIAEGQKTNVEILNTSLVYQKTSFRY
jgi:transcription antitermination factor NusG